MKQSPGVLIYIYLMTNDVEYLFMCLFDINIFGEISIQGFAHLKLNYLSFCCLIVGALIIFFYKSLIRYMIYQNFLLFCELCFYFLGRVLWCTNLFNFVDIYFICFCCCCLCFVSYLWNCCLITRSERCTPMFSSENSVVLALTFRSSIHFELVFVYGVK